MVLVLSPVISFKPTHRTKGRCYVTAKPLHFPSRYTGPTVADVGERAVTLAIQRMAPSSRNGDDAAVLATPAPNTRTVVSTDVLVEGRHFSLDWSSAEEVGRKAIVQNFADIEAMGARPVAALLGLTMPGHTPLNFVQRLIAGMWDKTLQHNSELVGGDLTRADTLIVSITAIGILGGSSPALTLDRARAGQRLVASGPIGYSAAGLALLRQRLVRHRRFKLRKAPIFQPDDCRYYSGYAVCQLFAQQSARDVGARH